MAKAVWSNEKIVKQLDSGVHWSGGSLTYSFPTSASGFPGGEAAGFSQLNAAQQAAATLTMELWDSLIAPNFNLAAGNSANIKFANTTTNIQYAHAYFPGQSTTAGSVWFNSNYGANSGQNNVVDPKVGEYGFQTFVHEAGHALGLNHPGNYNGGAPTYEKNALFRQDSHQYTVMSYFGADKTGADWVASDGKRYFAQTPMVLDIMALQNMYGVDTTTRTGDTTYGYNSNAGTSVFDFTLNPHPIVCLFDSSGNDTIDLSGSSYACVIDLNPGAFSNSDMMTSNISIAFSAWIENAVGTAQNDTLRGNALNNVLSGGAGSDTLIGGAGADTLYGGANDDTLDGGTGADLLVGGSGNDTYTVDDAGDIVTEAANGGTDAVRTSLSSYTLTGNVETLTYTGKGAFTAYGNASDNVITGGTSNQLFGLGGADTLIGGKGNDLLDGGSGADVMQGGLGNDTYVVDNAADVVTEGAKGGTDTVQTDLSTFQLGTNLEHLTYTGLGAFDGTGNAVANTMIGGALGDILRGLAGNDVLHGNAGNDLLDGGAGSDKMFGGAGDDTYVVDVAGDSITELANAGIDTVQTSLKTYTLGSNVENVTYIGAAAFKGTGNALNNTIVGGAGNDVLDGKAGNDVLVGGDGNDILIGGLGADVITCGAGADIVRFSVLNDSNTFSYDTITDFDASVDIIDLKLLDASTKQAGNQAFKYLGDTNFTGVAGQLIFSNGFLSADVNGDATADFCVYLQNVASLASAQFYL